MLHFAPRWVREDFGNHLAGYDVQDSNGQKIAQIDLDGDGNLYIYPIAGTTQAMACEPETDNPEFGDGMFDIVASGLVIESAPADGPDVVRHNLTVEN